MNKGNPWALLPIIVFLIIFLGGGIIAKDMYAVPTLLCFLIALVVALFQNRKVRMTNKMETLAKGIGNRNILTMVLIFLTAGAFTGAVGSIGGVESTVNFGLDILPPQFAVVGLFVIGCFISMSMGTSVGTITALAPIGYGIAVATGFSAPMCLAAVVSGAMFGDNLSMVSDTTIAAVNTQGCNMKDKFKQNFFIVLPAAIIAIVVFMCLTIGKTANVTDDLPYNFWKIVPYLFVLITAVIGLNVFIVLSGGTILALIIGLCLKDPNITFLTMLDGIGSGMTSMYDISLISIVVAGIVELIKANGGIDSIIYAIRKCVKGKKGAQAGIAVLVTLVDFFTANNTVAIVIAGPIAKDIATEYDIYPKRSAAILDIFGSFSQGIIPYGAQLLAAGSFIYQGTKVEISPIKIIPFLVYPIVMMLCAFIWIFFVKEKKDRKKQLAVVDGTNVDESSVEGNMDLPKEIQAPVLDANQDQGEDVNEDQVGETDNVKEEDGVKQQPQETKEKSLDDKIKKEE